MTLTKILVLIFLYCLKCTKFDQLILRKIIKIVATRCQILRLKCTKFDCGWGSATDPAGPCWGSLQRSPDPLAGLRRPTSKGRAGRGKEGGGEGKRREWGRREREREGEKGKGMGGERRGKKGEGKGGTPHIFLPGLTPMLVTDDVG